jgi:hypothetical protein
MVLYCSCRLHTTGECQHKDKKGRKGRWNYVSSADSGQALQVRIISQELLGRLAGGAVPSFTPDIKSGVRDICV